MLTLPENDYLFSSVPRMHLAFFGLALAVITSLIASWQLDTVGFTLPRSQVLLLGMSCVLVASICFILNMRRVGAHLLCAAALVSAIGIALINSSRMRQSLPYRSLACWPCSYWVGKRHWFTFSPQFLVPSASHPPVETHARHKRRGESYGVIFLDVDGLKKVNDELGHAAGDALLIEVANRLSELTRIEEKPFHLSGDEYLVLVENADADSISVVESRLEEINEHPFEFNGKSIQVSVSLGSAVGGADFEPEEVLKCADESMYERKAKETSRETSNNFVSSLRFRDILSA